MQQQRSMFSRHSKARRWVALLPLLACLQLVCSQNLDGTYTAAMLDLSCSSDLVFSPTNTNEVAAHISTQVQAATAGSTGLKIRATRRSFHSTAAFVCPGSAVRTHPDHNNKPVPISMSAPSPAAVSPDGNTTTVTLLMENMNGVLHIDKSAYQMRVQAGMLVTQLLKEATAAGMSVPLGSVPAFGDLSLGGVLATGGHGTGHMTISSLGDIVAELTWVDGLGNIHTDRRISDAGRALVGGLGVAGVVTELLLQLEPSSKTSISTWFKKRDSRLYQDVQEMLKESPHVLVVWRPDLHTYTAHILQKTNTSVPATCKMNNADLPEIVVKGLGKAVQMWQEDVHDLLPVTLPTILTAIQEASVRHTYAVNRWGLPTQKGVGETNAMQAISCGKKCLWTMGSKIAMDDVHMSIEMDQLEAWVQDVQAVIAADLRQHGSKPLRVLAPGYFWLRFGHGSQDFLSHTSGMKEPVQVQMSFMKSLARGLEPSKYGWVLDVLEQLTICKYKGKPHWGKNHERSFKHPDCPLRDRLPFWQQMESFRATSDPLKVFQPKLFEEIASRAPHRLSPGCSARGECYCSDHSHCDKGQQCLPSLAVPEFKACRLPGLL